MLRSTMKHFHSTLHELKHYRISNRKKYINLCIEKKKIGFFFNALNGLIESRGKIIILNTFNVSNNDAYCGL